MTTIPTPQLALVAGGQQAEPASGSAPEDDKSWIRDPALPDWAQCAGGFWHGCGPNRRR
jgi:hypothetical protein